MASTPLTIFFLSHPTSNLKLHFRVFSEPYSFSLPLPLLSWPPPFPQSNLFLVQEPKQCHLSAQNPPPASSITQGKSQSPYSLLYNLPTFLLLRSSTYLLVCCPQAFVLTVPSVYILPLGSHVSHSLTALKILLKCHSQ